MADRLLVRDLMKVGVATCATDFPVPDIARLLLEKDLEAVVVLNSEGHGVGIVSQDELVKAYAIENCHELTAEQVMRDNVPQLPPDIPLAAAAQIMLDQNIRMVFMTHHADGVVYPAAALSYRHLLRHLAAQDETEIKDLGVRAARKAPLETFFKRREEARRKADSSDRE